MVYFSFEIINYECWSDMAVDDGDNWEFIWVIIGNLSVVYIFFKIYLKQKHTGDAYIHTHIYTYRIHVLDIQIYKYILCSYILIYIYTYKYIIKFTIVTFTPSAQSKVLWDWWTWDPIQYTKCHLTSLPQLCSVGVRGNVHHLSQN